MGFPGRNLLYGGVSESRRGQDKDRRWWSPVRVRWASSLALQGSQVDHLRAPEQPGLSTYRLGAPESPESGHGAAPRRSRALKEETKR